MNRKDELQIIKLFGPKTSTKFNQQFYVCFLIRNWCWTMHNAHSTLHMAHLLCMLTALSFSFDATNEINLDLYYEVHRTRTSTERYITTKEKIIIFVRKFQCPSLKWFTRKWLFIHEKLYSDATFNIHGAITTLTLLPLLPNEQLEHQTNNSLSFLLFVAFLFVYCCCFSLCVLPFVVRRRHQFLERFHWLNMACHWGIQHTHTQHTTIKPEQFNIGRCCQKGPLQVIICSLS